MATSEIRKFQIKDGQVSREKLEVDFLKGADLDLTGGNNDAHLIVKDGVNADHAASYGQLQALQSNIAGGVQLRDGLAGSADLTGNTTGNTYADANNGYIKGDKFIITADGNLQLSDGTLEVKSGDAIIIKNDVAADTALALADVYKVDNTESADIIRASQVVDDLTSTSSTDVLSSGQGKVLDDKIGVNTAAIALNTTATANNLASIQALQAIMEVCGEEHSLVNAGDTATLANTPIAGTLKVWRNGIRIGAADYTLAGTTLTLANPVSEAGECIIVDYKHL